MTTPRPARLPPWSLHVGTAGLRCSHLAGLVHPSLPARAPETWYVLGGSR